MREYKSENFQKTGRASIFLSPPIRQEVQQQTSRLLGKVSPRVGIKVNTTRFSSTAEKNNTRSLRGQSN